MIIHEALQNFKTICELDLNRKLSDGEAIKMAERVIRYLLATEIGNRPSLSFQEQTVFDLIRNSDQSPLVREITCTLGLSSSRSGQRVVKSLMGKRLISRDLAGRLEILP
jgi:hypothetical protein